MRKIAKNVFGAGAFVVAVEVDIAATVRLADVEQRLAALTRLRDDLLERVRDVGAH